MSGASTSVAETPRLSDRALAVAILGDAELGDLRRNLRGILIMERLLGHPSGSLTQAMGNPAQAKGAYRFLETDAIMPSALWDANAQHAARSLTGLSLAYVVQDTTHFMFPHLTCTEGLGTMDTPEEHALSMHTALAVRPDGFPLGVLHSYRWARPAEEFHKAARRKKRPIEEKESFKWLRGRREARRLRDLLSPETRLIFVEDRESDIHESLEDLQGKRDGCVQRCNQDRKVDSPQGLLRATMAAQPVLGYLQVNVPRRGKQPERTATVTVRAKEDLRLTPPKIYPRRKPVKINVVHVLEENPPPGVEPLDWMLYTTEPVKTLEDCEAVVAIYRRRWIIEDYHLVLKDGCFVEDTQLKTATRIEKLIALDSPAAIKIMQMRILARVEPDTPCTTVLSDLEWRALQSYILKEPAPADGEPPTIRQAVRWIAQLGGFLGRKSDGMPGVRTLWRGWRILSYIVAGFDLNRFY